MRIKYNRDQKIKGNLTRNFDKDYAFLEKALDRLGLFNLRRSELIGTRQDNCSHENFLLPFTCYMI